MHHYIEGEEEARGEEGEDRKGENASKTKLKSLKQSFVLFF